MSSSQTFLFLSSRMGLGGEGTGAIRGAVAGEGGRFWVVSSPGRAELPVPRRANVSTDVGQRDPNGGIERQGRAWVGCRGAAGCAHPRRLTGCKNRAPTPPLPCGAAPSPWRLYPAPRSRRRRTQAPGRGKAPRGLTDCEARLPPTSTMTPQCSAAAAGGPGGRTVLNSSWGPPAGCSEGRRPWLRTVGGRRNWWYTGTVPLARELVMGESIGFLRANGLPSFPGDRGWRPGSVPSRRSIGDASGRKLSRRRGPSPRGDLHCRLIVGR